MEFMKFIKNGSASLFVIIFISSVILFYFVTFNGLANFSVLSSNILKKQQKNIRLKDLLIFSVEAVVRKRDIRFPAEFTWPGFSNNFVVINFDKEKKFIETFVLDKNRTVVEKVCAEIEFLSDKRVQIKNASV